MYEMHLFNKYILGLRYCLGARNNSDPNSQGLNLTEFIFKWEGGRWETNSDRVCDNANQGTGEAKCPQGKGGKDSKFRNNVVNWGF